MEQPEKGVEKSSFRSFYFDWRAHHGRGARRVNVRRILQIVAQLQTMSVAIAIVHHLAFFSQFFLLLLG